MGFAHGYLTLEYDNVVMYKVTDYYVPMHNSGIRCDDPDVAVSMAVKEADIVISYKDQRLPLLKELVSLFAYDGHPLVPLTVTNLG